MPPRRSTVPAKVRQHSAGGVVVTEGLVLLIATGRGERWQLPKGRIEPGESAPQAAEREIREETGVCCRVDERLGDVEYLFTSREGRTIHKRVTYFLCSYLSGSVRDYAREEVWTATWMPLESARERLTFGNERQMLERTVARLAELAHGERRDAGEPRGPQPLS